MTARMLGTLRTGRPPSTGARPHDYSSSGVLQPSVKIGMMTGRGTAKRCEVIFIIMTVVLDVTTASIPTNPCPLSTPCVCRIPLVVRESMQVDCQGKKLNGIPTFDGIGVAEKITLTYNKIPDVKADAFKGISPREIDFSHNDISNIDEDAFIGLDRSLRKLGLKSNKFQTVPSASLGKLRSLQILNLDNNPGLKALSSRAFKGLGALQKLTLSQCSVSDIKENAFEGLINLTDLVLYENHLNTISSSIFSGLFNLEHLDLGHNYIKNIPAHAFRNVKRLGLNMNDFSSDDSFHPDAFAGVYVSLEYLNLADCRMKRIPNHALRKLRSLEELDLTHNRINVIEQPHFQGLENLQRLILDNNNVQFTEHALLEVSISLRYLSMRKMSMKTIPLTVLQDLVALQYIDISGNEFESLGDNFFNGVCAKRYIIKNASIQRVSKIAFNNTVNGLHVDIQRNTVHNLKFIDIPCKFDEVKADQNYINCDCDLIKLLNRHNVTIDGDCYRPPELQTLPIGSANFRDYGETNCAIPGDKSLATCSHDVIDDVFDGDLSPSRCYSNRQDANTAAAHALRVSISGILVAALALVCYASI